MAPEPVIFQDRKNPCRETLVGECVSRAPDGPKQRAPTRSYQRILRSRAPDGPKQRAPTRSYQRILRRKVGPRSPSCTPEFLVDPPCERHGQKSQATKNPRGPRPKKKTPQTTAEELLEDPIRIRILTRTLIRMQPATGNQQPSNPAIVASSRFPSDAKILQPPAPNCSIGIINLKSSRPSEPQNRQNEATPYVKNALTGARCRGDLMSQDLRRPGRGVSRQNTRCPDERFPNSFGWPKRPPVFMLAKLFSVLFHKGLQKNRRPEFSKKMDGLANGRRSQTAHHMQRCAEKGSTPTDLQDF